MSLLGDDIEHSVEMSPIANQCLYTLDTSRLEQIDSSAAGD
jgi:hypothetical protein